MADGFAKSGRAIWRERVCCSAKFEYSRSDSQSSKPYDAHSDSFSQRAPAGKECCRLTGPRRTPLGTIESRQHGAEFGPLLLAKLRDSRTRRLVPVWSRPVGFDSVR